MESNNISNKRPVALVILDGWGYGPPIERNAIANARTPNYDKICRTYPMTTLAPAAENAETGHLSLGTGRVVEAEAARVQNAIASGSFMKNEVLNSAFSRAKTNGSSVHFVGMLSDSGVHSSPENLYALLRLAKQHDLENVFVHCILDGLDVPERTADVYVEALEVKLSDIGVGKIATLCGRFFAMDSGENWERTARAYTMLVHGEGERAPEAVKAVRSSFLRGISDEFTSPIVLEKEPNIPVGTLTDGDLVVFFNHRGDAIRQLVRSVSMPDGTTGSKPFIDTVCLTEYDPGFGLPVAFGRTFEVNTLTDVLSGLEIPSYKITEASRFHHLTHFFDGGSDVQHQYEQQVLVSSPMNGSRFGQPEAESFKITDKFLRNLESTDGGVFVVNIPAAGLMAQTGDMAKTISAIQYVDTCLGGIYDSMQERDGVIMLTSTHGNCEQIADPESEDTATPNPLPFHYIDARAEVSLRKNGSLQDVAPTILGVLGIEKPAEMTGVDLRVRA